MRFLLNAGVGWCGTTPFYFTLAKDYCHAGHQKENAYLKLLTQVPDDKLERFLADKRKQVLPQDQWVQIVDNSIALDDDLYAPPYTLDRYVDYYRKLYEKTKSNYHAVADFSTANFKLPEDFLVELRDKLSQYFDVRVIILFRDPINRYFSEVGTHLGKNSHIKRFKESLTTRKIKKHAYYVQGIQKFDRVFGKDRVMPIIMEEFWTEKNTEKLSEFLQYPIEKIVPCVPRGGNRQEMTPELYDWALQYLGFVYDDWENYYGAIPKYWKRFPQVLH